MRLRNISLSILIMMGGYSYSQQDAMYTHYAYNTLTINPAYAGSRDAVTITALHRSQWVGFDGAPQTHTLTLHSPLFNKQLGGGISVVNDQIGPTRTTSVYGDLAYIIDLGKNSNLSFGIKGGINQFNARLSGLKITDQSDITFQGQVQNLTLPNCGFGVYYYSPKWYAGISVPKILENDVLRESNNGHAYVGSEKRHFYFIGGNITKFKGASWLQLKTSSLVKLTGGAPIEVDLTSSIIIHNKLETGVMYRTNDAFGVLLGYNASKQLYLGYSFDYSFGNKTFKFNSGSHELILRYDLFVSKQRKIRSPRYYCYF